MHGWWERQGRAVLAGAFGLGLAVAVWGFMEQGQSLANAAHLALQLIVLNVDLSADPIGWQLQLTRFVLPGLTAYATIKGALALAGYHAHFLHLKWRPPETILLGAGGIAVGLMDRLESKHPVVALDLDIDQSRARTLAARGAELVRGDATNSVTLRRLNVARASVVYILTGDDQRNLDIAREVCGLLGDRSGPKPRLVVSVTEHAILRVASQDPDFLAYRSKAGGAISWFNLPAQAARVLLSEHPPDRERGPAGAGGGVHVAIAGFGAMGQAIALQAARNCVFADASPLKLTVFAESDRAPAEFLLRYPALDPAACDPAHGGFAPVADLRFVPYKAESTAPAAVRKAQAVAPFNIVYVAMDDDHASLTTAWRFAQTTRATGAACKVVCVLPGTRFGTELEASELRKSGSAAHRDVEVFHSVTRSVRPGETYPGATLDHFAIAIDAAYGLAGGSVRGRLTREAIEARRKAWEETLSDGFRWSSRHSADHIPVKLRAIGYDLREAGAGPAGERVDGRELAGAIQDNLEMLERMEHRRYCIERLLDGWLHAASADEDEERRNKAWQLNRTIVPFDQLPQQEQLKDRSIVSNIPEILAVVDDSIVVRRGR